MSNFLILIAGIAAIIWVNWYFFLAPKAAVTVTGTRDGGRQEVTITVEGGYSPSVIRVKKGTPVRLWFNRKEKSPCSEEVVISAFGIRRFLKAFEKTPVDLTPLEAGSFEFTCGMSMLRGRIEVEA